jgi:dihydroorotase
MTSVSLHYLQFTPGNFVEQVSAKFYRKLTKLLTVFEHVSSQKRMRAVQEKLTSVKSKVRQEQQEENSSARRTVKIQD